MLIRAVGGVRESVRISDRVIIRAFVLAAVGSKSGGPCLVVQSTVLTDSLVVVVEDISIEELTGLRYAVCG